MRTPVNRIERAAGWFGVVVALLVLGALGFARREELSELFHSSLLLYAMARDASGIVVGSPVRLHEVEIGSVVAVDIVHDSAFVDRPVRVTLRVRPRAAGFVKNDTVAMLGGALPGLAGSEVNLRTSGDRPAQQGCKILGEPSPSILKLLGTDFGTLRTGVEDMLAELEPVLKNVHTITDDLASGRGFAGALLKDGATSQKLDALLTDARELMAEARALLAETQKVAQQVPGTMREADGALKEGRQLMGTANAAMADVPALLASMQKTLQRVDALVQDLGATARFAPELVRKVDTTLEETQRLVTAAQQNFLIRGSVPARLPRPTDAVVRPPLSFGDGGAP
jgi:ABC-type transporter Mla subunit MlaD